eukprot:Gb_06805 [translate_table: standard]
MLLKEKGLWSIVTGVEPKPLQPQVAVQNWIDKDEKAHAAIVLNLENSIVAQVKGAQNAKEAYDKLKTLYETKSMTAKLALH